MVIPFIEPPGFINSAFPYILHPVSSLTLLRRMSGVLPIAGMDGQPRMG